MESGSFNKDNTSKGTSNNSSSNNSNKPPKNPSFTKCNEDSNERRKKYQKEYQKKYRDNSDYKEKHRLEAQQWRKDNKKKNRIMAKESQAKQRKKQREYRNTLAHIEYKNQNNWDTFGQWSILKKTSGKRPLKNLFLKERVNQSLQDAFKLYDNETFEDLKLHKDETFNELVARYFN